MGYWDNFKAWRLPRLQLPDGPDTIDYFRYAWKVRKAWRSTLAAAISAALTLSLMTYLAHRVIDANTKRTLLNEKRRQRQERRKRQFESLSMRVEKRNMPVEAVERIVSIPIVVLQQQLLSGEINPMDVLTAYQTMALKAHDKTNCLVEPIFQAEEWVEELIALGEGERGPLYGIPVSLKENFSLEGYDTTEGSAHLIGCPVEQESTLVTVLRSLGAVPFVRTNMPQLGFSHEGSNPIFGGTVNPYDPSRSPGGSSSGEAALLALKGSLLGFGSDTAGSIRCPAAFCGVCALKPTLGRISAKGRPDFNGQTIVNSLSCPMTQDVDTLIVVMRALCTAHTAIMHSLDPFCPTLTFNEKVLKSKEPLKIGVLRYDGICQAVPACTRALDQARDILEKAGHELVEWSLPGLSDSFWWNILAQCGDSGANMRAALEHDEVDPSLQLQNLAAQTPVWIKRIAAKLVSLKLPWTARCIEATLGVWSASEWWELTRRVQTLRERVVKSWQTAGLHAVITPGMGTPALPLGSSSEALYSCSYIMLFNTLNFPAGVVPGGVCTQADTAEMAQNYRPHFEVQHSLKKKLSHGSEGLPVSVQCATLPWEEELCLRVMKEIEDGFKKVQHTQPLPTTSKVS